MKFRSTFFQREKFYRLKTKIEIAAFSIQENGLELAGSLNSRPCKIVGNIISKEYLFMVYITC